MAHVYFHEHPTDDQKGIDELVKVCKAFVGKAYPDVTPPEGKWQPAEKLDKNGLGMERSKLETRAGKAQWQAAQWRKVSRNEAGEPEEEQGFNLKIAGYPGWELQADVYSYKLNGQAPLLKQFLQHLFDLYLEKPLDTQVLAELLGGTNTANIRQQLRLYSDPDAALEYLEKMLRKYKGPALDFFYEKRDLLEKTGDDAALEEWYNNYFEVEPHNKEITALNRQRFAEFLCELERYEEALEALEVTVQRQLRSHSRQALRKQVRILHQDLGATAEAQQKLKAAVPAFGRDFIGATWQQLFGFPMPENL